MSFLTTGIQDHLFTSGEVLVAKRGRILLHEKETALRQQRFFDLASLTKPLATTLLVMLAVQDKKLSLDDPIEKFFATKTLRGVTLSRFLNHTSPLVDWFEFRLEFKSADKILTQILNEKKLIRKTRETRGVLYSDLGFILVGAILEKTYKQDLATLFAKKIAKPLRIEAEAFFVDLHHKRKFSVTKFVPTEDCKIRRKTMQGEVMDENAWLMHGVAGHAGLFATADAVHKILLELRRAKLGKSKLFAKKTFSLFCLPKKNRKPTERYFTLGFDTPTKPYSQSGNSFSKDTIGHLGFSGTSFWWDLKKDFWIILLTNRCIHGRANKAFVAWRPLFHDNLMMKLK